MKKKILISLVLVIGFLMVNGCGNVRKEPNNNKEQNINTNTEDRLIISGYDLTLTEEGSFSKIKFKYPNGGIISNPITSYMILYPKKDSTEYLFRVIIGDMYGTDIDSSMQGFTKEGTKTINDIEWTIYTDSTGKKSYGVNIDYSNIVIGFIYDDPNLSKFEEEFMNSVTLNK